MNFEEKIIKTTHKEVTENSDASSKIWSRNWRNKLRRRRNVVEKSQTVEKVWRDLRLTLGDAQFTKV